MIAGARRDRQSSGASPLIRAHLRLLELADLYLLTDPAMRQALTLALGQTQYRMPYVYAQKLSMSENRLS